MKKAVPAEPRAGRKPNSAASDVPTHYTPVFKPPLKPRRKVFYGLLGVFGAWVVLLLTLYFVTVFPHRGESPPHQTVEPNSGEAASR